MSNECQSIEKKLKVEFGDLRAIEKIRNRKALLIAASALDKEALPTFYDILETMGPQEQLDIILYGRGGEIVSAKRYAALLHQFAKAITFIVPFHCQSTFTALCLCGHAIIAGDMAMFSPIDTSLNTDGQGAISSEDLRLFSDMGKDWFGLDSEEARAQLLAALAGSIFPTTLTSLYRSNLEVTQIANDLLAMGSPAMPEEKRNDIVRHLIQGYHSHHYAPTNSEFLEMGLPIVRDAAVEKLAWQLSKKIGKIHGGAVREKADEPRNDFFLATSEVCFVRRKYPKKLNRIWQQAQIVA